MEDPDCILDALNDFEKKNCNDIPDRLEQLLCDIARTGDIRFPWSKIKKLFICKLELAIEEFVDCNPNEEIPVLPNVENVEFEEMKIRLLTALETFSSAPFTIQRLCELVTDPKKYYSRSDKFMRGIEKNVIVVTTVKQYNRLSTSEATTNGTAMVNGLLSECIKHVPTEFSSESDVNEQTCVAETEMLIEKGDGVSSTEMDQLEDAMEENEQLSDEAETEGEIEEKEANSGDVERSDEVVDQVATAVATADDDTENMQVTSSKAEEQPMKMIETDHTDLKTSGTLEETTDMTSLEETSDKVTSLEEAVVDKVTSVVDETSDKGTCLVESSDNITSLEGTSDKVTSLEDTSNVSSLEETSDKVSSLEETSDKVSSLEEPSAKVSSLEETSDKVSSLEETSDKVSSLEETSDKVSSLEETSDKVSSLEETSDKVSSLEETSDKVSSLEETIGSTTSLEETSDNISSLEASTEEEESAIVSTTVSDSGQCEDIDKGSGDTSEALGRKHKDTDTDVCEPNAKRPRYGSEDVETVPAGEDELDGVSQSETNIAAGDQLEPQSENNTLDSKADDIGDSISDLKQDDMPVSQSEEPNESEESKQAGDTMETDSKEITEQNTEQIETEIKQQTVAECDQSTDKSEDKPKLDCPVESEEPMDQS